MGFIPLAQKRIKKNKVKNSIATDFSPLAQKKQRKSLSKQKMDSNKLKLNNKQCFFYGFFRANGLKSVAIDDMDWIFLDNGIYPVRIDCLCLSTEFLH